MYSKYKMLNIYWRSSEFQLFQQKSQKVNAFEWASKQIRGSVNVVI